MAGNTSLRNLGLVLCAFLCSCQGLYFSTMERFGVDKRDILVERLETTNDALVVAGVRFDDAVAAYRSVFDAEEGRLEQQFENLSTAQRRCESASEDVNEAIASVQSVATLMFDDWKAETGEIMDADLRRASRDNYTKATARYERTLRAFRRFQARMDPVLTTFRDHVLFLKLNLHPHALGALQEQEEDIVADVKELGELIESAANETTEFNDSMSY